MKGQRAAVALRPLTYAVTGGQTQVTLRTSNHTLLIVPPAAAYRSAPDLRGAPEQRHAPDNPRLPPNSIYQQDEATVSHMFPLELFTSMGIFILPYDLLFK